MQKASGYSKLNINEIKSQAIALKHKRTLAKKQSLYEVNQIDLDYLALCFETLYRVNGKFPKDTQILSVLLSIINSNYVIEEIATGEGKGLIAAIQAAYLCFQGQTVDVTTSSQELAKQGRREFAAFYQALGLNIAEEIIEPTAEVGVYQKNGINYAVASDLALFRANRDFYSNTRDIELNADVSLVSDEADFVLTSDINFKLAAPLVKITQQEARALMQYIIDFSKTEHFANSSVSAKADIANLKLYLEHQFKLYDNFYQYPLSISQLEILQKSKNTLEQKLYYLHGALTKINKHADVLFDKLLTSVVSAQALREKIDYVNYVEDNKNTLPLRAVPIIKSQPSKETMFADGVQSFLHLLIEDQYPELKNQYDISLPLSIVINVSPKNFFDYYRMSGGIIIGMTGTAGNEDDIKEFKTINKINTVGIPRYEISKKKTEIKIAKNKDVQYDQVKKILSANQRYGTRPVIIFTESTKEAEKIYQKVKFLRKYSQLFAISQSDTAKSVNDIISNAGQADYLTVTTPMLGRGTDFSTRHPGGFLGINLCTNITPSVLEQIYGRVARNGHPGDIISVFNKEFLGALSIEDHMKKIVNNERNRRKSQQQLTDILMCANNLNYDDIPGAIEFNDFIAKQFNKLSSTLGQTKHNSINLRNYLFKVVINKYPIIKDSLSKCLELTDGFFIDKKSFLQKEKSVNNNQDTSHDTETVKIDKDWNFKEVNALYNSIPLSLIETKAFNNKNKTLFTLLAKMQAMVMLTHVFSLKPSTFTISMEHQYKLSYNMPTDRSIPEHEFVLFLKDDKIYGQIANNQPIEISAGYTFTQGIPTAIYQQILNKLKNIDQNNPIIALDTQEQQAIQEYANAVNYIKKINVDGEGSRDALMLNEFKKSFKQYQKSINNIEVDNIAECINNFVNIKQFDTTKLQHGHYQAIQIVTNFTDTSGHFESFITDGDLLFWVNRGGGSDGEPGIKIFKIKQNIDVVKTTLEWLKQGPYSQTKTREKIYTLLKDQTDKNEPTHILIHMPAQTVGNCGWTQSEGILKVIALINQSKLAMARQNDIYKQHKTQFNKLKLLVESQEWQKILKDSEDIYQDFIAYDMVTRLESLLLAVDKNFTPAFLNKDEQTKIKAIIDITGNYATHKLLESLSKTIKDIRPKFINTIYNKPIIKILETIDLHIAIDSTAGQALQRASDRQSAIDLLAQYQQNKNNTFEQLYKIHAELRISDTKVSDALFLAKIKLIL